MSSAEKYCNCADPQNCTQRVPGYRCKKDFLPSNDRLALIKQTLVDLEKHGHSCDWGQEADLKWCVAEIDRLHDHMARMGRLPRDWRKLLKEEVTVETNVLRLLRELHDRGTGGAATETLREVCKAIGCTRHWPSEKANETTVNFTRRDAEAMANAAIALDRNAFKAKLANIADWLENGCDPKYAAQELRLIIGIPKKTGDDRNTLSKGHGDQPLGSSGDAPLAPSTAAAMERLFPDNGFQRCACGLNVPHPYAEGICAPDWRAHPRTTTQLEKP